MVDNVKNKFKFNNLNESSCESITKVKSNIFDNSSTRSFNLNTSKIRNNSMKHTKNDDSLRKTNSILDWFSIFQNKNDPVQEENKFNLTVEELSKYYIEQKELNFNINQFLEMFLIHILYFLFGPFVVPLLKKIWGIYTIKNLGFWGKKLLRIHILQLIFFLNFVFTIIISIYTQGDDKPKSDTLYSQYVFLTPSYLSQILVLVHYIVVCIKYGFYPKDYFNRSKIKSFTTTELRSNFLQEGWIEPSSLCLDCYLKEVLQKLNIDIKNFKILCIGKVNEMIQTKLDENNIKIKEDVAKIRKSFCRRLYKQFNLNISINELIRKNYRVTIDELEKQDRESMFSPSIIIPSKLKFKLFFYRKILPIIRKQIRNENLDGKLKMKSENIFEINGVDLIRLILKDVFSLKLSNYNFILYFSTAIFCINPMIFVFYYYKNSKDMHVNWLSYFLLSLSVLSLIPPSYLNLLNLTFGVIDFKRKKMLMEICSVLINSKNILSEKRHYPFINILDYNSILSWYYIRTALFKYGNRFSKRITFQASVFFILSILGIIISILTYLQNNHLYLAFCLGISFTFCISLSSLFVFFMFFLGASANHSMTTHRDHLLKHSLLLTDLQNSINLLNNTETVPSEDIEESFNLLKKQSSNGNDISNDIIALFSKLIRSDSEFNINNITKSIDMTNIISKKIKFDNIVAPLTIFTITTDYTFFSRLIALIGTAISLVISNVFKNLNLNKFYKS